jgi:hypothetical protein
MDGTYGQMFPGDAISAVPVRHRVGAQNARWKSAGHEQGKTARFPAPLRLLTKIQRMGS